ncbi:hypothetical protein HMPREF9628_00135 [Peptoanaerobacter stomatis]|uniref:Phage tail tape measure protein domain-containing protein n=1 Tax=Peptoanaerobacter stomatis TaxID=796937 RepID=G9XA44_9FIRM|nr:hypothetical protein HMPREF9628_00135 [Peptoanaerobacter stomatis]
MAGFIGYRRTIQLSFNYDEVKQGIPDVKKQIALLDAEFRKAMAQANASGNSLDKLGLKHEHLSQKIVLQRDKISKLQQALEKARQGTGDTSKAVARYTIDLKNAETELIKMEAEQKKLVKELEFQKTKLGQVSSAWQDFTQNAREAGTDVNRVASNMQKIGAGMVGLGVASSKAFLDFDKEFQKVLTIADETQVPFDKLKQGALDVARNFNVASGETANALYDILSSGIKTSDSLELLAHTAKLAQTGITDMTTAGDILTTIINTYGLSVKDATKITDQLIITQKVGKNTVGQMGDQFGKVAGLAGTLKIPFEEVGAALSTMTIRGVKADEAITSIRGILTSVIQPTKEAKEVASQYGIELSATAIRSKGFSGFLDEIVRKTHGNDEALSSMFGNVRALNGILMLTGQEGIKTYNDNLEQIKNSTGATNEAFNKISDTASFKLSSAWNDLKVSAIEAGATFTPFIELLSKFLGILSKTPPQVVTVISSIGGLLLIVGTIVKTLDGIFGANGLIKTGSNLMSGFNSLLGDATFAAFAKWAAIIVGVTLAITALVIAINYLMGKGKEMNKGVEQISGAIGNAKQSVNGASHRAYAIGTTYSQGGRARLHEYGDETVDLPSGSRIYTAEQSRQMMDNMKRNDDKIVNAIDKLWSKLDSLENKVLRLPDRQLMLSREMG